jgi:hypothetical protein
MRIQNKTIQNFKELVLLIKQILMEGMMKSFTVQMKILLML